MGDFKSKRLRAEEVPCLARMETVSGRVQARWGAAVAPCRCSVSAPMRCIFPVLTFIFLCASVRYWHDLRLLIAER